jgi:hypothetical protein
MQVNSLRMNQQQVSCTTQALGKGALHVDPVVETLSYTRNEYFTRYEPAMTGSHIDYGKVPKCFPIANFSPWTPTQPTSHSQCLPFWSHGVSYIAPPAAFPEITGG